MRSRTRPFYAAFAQAYVETSLSQAPMVDQRLVGPRRRRHGRGSERRAGSWRRRDHLRVPGFHPIIVTVPKASVELDSEPGQIPVRSTGSRRTQCTAAPTPVRMHRTRREGGFSERYRVHAWASSSWQRPRIRGGDPTDRRQAPTTPRRRRPSSMFTTVAAQAHGSWR